MQQGVNLLANFPLSSAFFSYYRNMRTFSKTINLNFFLGNACSKNNSLRERVDSRVQHVWRLQVMGSCKNTLY